MPPGQATYGIVASNYSTDHLQAEELAEPPTFFYAMDLGGGRFFMEEPSLARIIAELESLGLPSAVDRRKAESPWQRRRLPGPTSV
jgi:hypothetical protein